MIRYIVVISLIFALVKPAMTQELVSKRTQADRLFERAEYFRAVDLYLELAESDNVKVAVLERIADCYRLMNNYDQAENWYERLSNTQGIRPVDIYFYAELLLRNKKFEKAKAMYKWYFANETNTDQLDLKVASCDSAAAWMKLDGNYKVVNEKKMNSGAADWGVIYADSINRIFTSDRATDDYNGNRGIYYRTGNEWLKMFNYNTKTSQISELVFDNRLSTVNLSKEYHRGPMAINATGDTAYITVTTQADKGSLASVKTAYDQQLYIRRLELMVAVKKDGYWGSFTRFPYDNVASYSVGHAALSKDGRKIYFTSDMPGGFGRTDIWYCEKLGNGQWGKPVNCGKAINTPNEEAFPAIGGDGQLYFSSKGLPGMGGFDVFSAMGSGANWTTPVNLKWPLNSTSDDFAFATQDGKSGYVASDRQGGSGNDDIYSFTFIGKDIRAPLAVKPVASPTPPPAGLGITGSSIPPGSFVVIEGGVYDNNTGRGIDSVTVLLKNQRGQTIDGAQVGRADKFSFKITTGQEYTVEVRKKGYYPIIKTIPATGISAELKLALQPLTVGKTFIIRNIYYDLNRANIRADAVPPMDNLVQVMKDNPTLRIELSSHTDSRGSDYYNMLLSNARAVSAVAYLRRHGIAANRMVAKGYGETRLLNECANGVRCSEEDHQFNRRTEIKVIGQ